KRAAQNTFDQAVFHFIEMFYADQTLEINRESIKKYDEVYHDFHRNNPEMIQKWTEREEIELTLPTDEIDEPLEIIEQESASYEEKLKPRPAQKEALCALEETVAEDYDKAMVVMATGLGKTYLAAFFAEKYKK